MAVYAPNTDLRLLSAPLTFGDGNQLDFANATAQHNYFANLPGRNFTDFTYQRKDDVIRIPDLAENLYQYNYVMYQNFAGKWIYAFITRIEFVNQNCTHVHIKTDVFQTWQFNFTFKQSLVEREHTVTDNPYEHTLPEPLHGGTMIEVSRQRATSFALQGDTQSDFEANYRVVFCLSDELTGVTSMRAVMVGGVPDVAYYYAVERANMAAFSDMITAAARADAVLGVYAVPISAVSFVQLETTPFNIWTIHDANETYVTFTPEKGNAINNTSITFRNLKCLCYPYHYYSLWASNGQRVDLKTENFTSIHPIAQAETCTIRTTCNPSQDTSLMIAPMWYEYNGQPSAQPYAQYGVNLDYAITFNDFPEIAFATDVFKNYMALNKSSVRAQMFNTAVDTIFGMWGGALSGVQAAGDLFAGVSSGNMGQTVGAIGEVERAGHSMYRTIGNALSAYARYNDMQRTPDRIQGVRSSGVQLMSSVAGAYVSEYALKGEYMQIVDDFFTRFGYRVDTLKVPQFNSRPNHNYLKTADCNIEGDMPQDDADEMCAMFNAGLTVWHNPATFGNYSPNNSPA